MITTKPSRSSRPDDAHLITIPNFPIINDEATKRVRYPGKAYQPTPETPGSDRKPTDDGALAPDT